MDITKRKITKIAREISKLTARTLRNEGVGIAEFDLIHAVRKHPGITQAEICKLIEADKGAVARQTSRLAAKGYLTRQDNPADGRSQLLFATEKAQALKSSKTHIETLAYEWLLEPLSSQEKEEFSRLLDIIYRRCKAESRANFPRLRTIINGGIPGETEK